MTVVLRVFNPTCVPQNSTRVLPKVSNKHITVDGGRSGGRGFGGGGDARGENRACESDAKEEDSSTGSGAFIKILEREQMKREQIF